MSFQVIVLFKGEEYPIDTSKAELIKEFRKKVFDATKIKPSTQQLLYGGKFLSDKNQANLCDYRIEDGYKVHLSYRPPLQEVKKNNNANANDVNENDSKKETSPPPFMEEREPDEPLVMEEREPDEPLDTSAAKEENDVSKEDQIAKLREIGAAEDLIAEIEKEGQSEEAQEPEQCAKCKKNPDRKCFECGCRECGGKEDPDVQLFCEECQYVTHIYCLDPPITREEMDALPDEWYCPHCKRDVNEIVNKGEAVRLGKRAKMPSNAKPQKRDWGNGKATAGVEKKCTIVGPHHFGPIPGIDVGMSWQYRVQVCSTGAHRPPVAGISGQSKIGCQSIVLAGGYEDDKDEGTKITYTGAGGRDLSGNKRTDGQSFDQRLEATNLSLAVSCDAPVNHRGTKVTANDWKKSKPIRVLRSFKGSIFDTKTGHPASIYAPAYGIRYDGIYRMMSYENVVGKSGKKIWQFVLQRDDPAPAPWEDGAPQYSCIIDKEENAAKEMEKYAMKRKNQGIKLVTPKNPGPKDPIYEPSDDILDLIRKDAKNDKKWAEILEKKVRKDKWFENVEEEFTCTGCALVIGNPVTMPCGHSACLECLERFHKGKFEEPDKDKKIIRECWECRYDLQDEEYKAYKNKDLKAALENIFPGYTNERNGIAPKIVYNVSPKKKAPKKKASPQKKKASPQKKNDQDLTKIPKKSMDEPTPSTSKSYKKPGPKSRRKKSNDSDDSIDVDDNSKSPKKSEKSSKSVYKPGPKSKMEKSNDSDDSIDVDETSKSPKKLEKSSKTVYKPGPKSKKTKKTSESAGIDDDIIDEETPPTQSTSKSSKKGGKPGPKSRKRKRNDSECVSDEDDNDELEAKKPRTLNGRQKKLLGEIDYNIDQD